MEDENLKLPSVFQESSPEGMLFKKDDRVTLSGSSAIKRDKSFVSREGKDKICTVEGFLLEGLALSVNKLPVEHVLVVVRFDDGQKAEYWPVELNAILL